MSAKTLSVWRIVKRVSWGLLAAPLLVPALVNWDEARDDQHLRDSIRGGMTQTEVEKRLSMWHADPTDTCQEVNGWGKEYGYVTTGKNDACNEFHHMRDYQGEYAGLRVRYNARVTCPIFMYQQPC